MPVARIRFQVNGVLLANSQSLRLRLRKLGKRIWNTRQLSSGKTTKSTLAGWSDASGR
jgi:hypothetical protein